MATHRPEDASGRGARLCRRLTRRHAKTFYLASAYLPRPTRAHAYAVYGFCRWADNGVDDAPTPAEARLHLDRVRGALNIAYSRAPAPPGLAEFRRTVKGRCIPKSLFEDLLEGMAMDLHLSRYHDFAALDVYCHRVAGVVGLMMTHVFGFRDGRCLPHARALGTAMQLTNILRDVAEDGARGRIYLPQDELARFGVTEQQVLEGRVDDAFRALMRFQIARARSYYAEAEAGIPWLSGDSSRLTVRVMGRLYAGILRAIEALDGDVFHTRAHVPLARKLNIMVACQAETWRDRARRYWG